MKKLLGILLALALLLGCTVAFADPITLTYAEVNPVPATLEENNESGSVVSDVAWAFKTKLEELSNGEILVDLQGGGVMAAVQYDFGIFSGSGAGQRDGTADAPGGSGNQDCAHSNSNTVITAPMLSREETWEAEGVSRTSNSFASPTNWR